MGSLFHPTSEAPFGAIRQVVGLVRKVAAKFRGFGGAPSTAADPTCDRLAGLDRIPQIVRGSVVRSGIGSYDCEVSVDGGRCTVVCSTLAPVLSDTYGVSQACMPAPGSSVLVCVEPAGLTQGRPMRGVILGVIPDATPHGYASGDGPVSKVADTEFPEGGVAQFTEAGPSAIASDSEYPYRGEFQGGRPHDIVPGEYALLNHAGAGLVIGAVSTTVKGSEMASIRCSALDNQVRVTSGHFRHISAAGGDEIFNDCGYITVESFVSMYHPERLGVQKTGDAAFKWSPVQPLSAQERRSGIEQARPSQTAKKRLYRYTGYLGDIVNVFVASPDPSKAIEEMASPGVDRGLLHYHVDSSGRLTVRSAAGILFERYDRIPVPKRRHYAWDPAGNTDAGSPKPKRPFKVKDDPPMGIGLTLGDAAAWWNSQAYARFIQFDRDFSVPGQEDLKTPEDDYDRLGNASEQYKEYDLRHSYIGLTPNGGIVLRDAWGSEIIMADGRITFNAAANIEVRSGSTVVVMGGDDVVVKAYNSMDLSATKKDVRVKAENNLQVVSMKRGVLIQSKSRKDADPSAWDKSGEDLKSGGVVIKADSSTVAVAGRRAEIQGSEGVSVASLKEDKPSGSVVFVGRQVSAVATDNVVATAQGTSGIVIDGQSATLVAPSVLTVGGQSASDVAGNHMMLGIPVDVESMYSSMVAMCKDQTQRYVDNLSWLRFPASVVSRVDFKFRTTKQYGTDGSAGLAGGVFSVYQPSWAMLAAARRPLLDKCRLQEWDEGKDADGEFPWPGKEAMEQKSYFTYRERNVTRQGLESVKSGETGLTAEAFSSYHIRKRT